MIGGVSPMRRSSRHVSRTKA
ncbi:hypothetical protein RSAG8_13959, partial [Rhizoctonia solani AG-8 WAC10335]